MKGGPKPSLRLFLHRALQLVVYNMLIINTSVYFISKCCPQEISNCRNTFFFVMSIVFTFKRSRPSYAMITALFSVFPKQGDRRPVLL